MNYYNRMLCETRGELREVKISAEVLAKLLDTSWYPTEWRERIFAMAVNQVWSQQHEEGKLYAASNTETE